MVIRELLCKAVNEDTANNCGWTPLHLAAESGHVELICELLRNGASMDVGDNNGKRPLHMAAKGGHV
jgi:serine/threonine-protein phosphatase 6 regulatory ankyrin repeat subunit B